MIAVTTLIIVIVKSLQLEKDEQLVDFQEEGSQQLHKMLESNFQSESTQQTFVLKILIDVVDK